MTDFDSKWQHCVARAREAEPREENVPFGLAARIVTTARVPAEAALASVWRRLALGGLACAVTVLAVSAILELPHLRDTRPFDPGVENTVAQLVWRL